MRSVLQAYEPAVNQPQTTCGRSPTLPCISSKLGQDEVVLRDTRDGVVYRLGAVVLTAGDVASADAVYSQTNLQPGWLVKIVLTPDATERFGEASAAMVGQQLAFVVDGFVVSAPMIEVPITEGKLVLTGDFSAEEADRLATALSPG
jgi:preprotein translocase subunit SecD